MLEYRNVSKIYHGDERAIADVNLTITKGSLFVLVGPSGSGKSTLLKMVNRLVEPTLGDIYLRKQRVKDYDLRDLRLHVGYVLQNISLFPNLTILDNIGIQLEEMRVPKEQREQRARELLALVDLDPEKYAKRLPAELSGGEQQRVGIIRALAPKPDLILMDEPFSALDPVSRRNLQDLILKIHQELKMTIMFVTHDMNEALRLGQEIGIMRQGKLLQVATPAEIMASPQTDFVNDFFADAKQQEGPVIPQLVQNHALKIALASNLPKVNRELPLPELLAALREHPDGVQVVVAQQNYQLTLTQLLDFIEAGGLTADVATNN